MGVQQSMPSSGFVMYYDDFDLRKFSMGPKPGQAPQSSEPVLVLVAVGAVESARAHF